MKRAIYLAAVLLSVSATAAGAASEISGVIYSAETLEPLQGVNVLLEDIGARTISDRNGSFKLSGLISDGCTIQFSVIGFRTERQALSMTADSRERIEVWLKPEALKLGQKVVVIGKRGEQSKVEELLEEKLSNTDELLKGVEGISVVRRGNTNSDPVIRGLKEGRINVTIDGAKIVGACPGRMDPPTTYLEIGELENIDIVKGPNSVTMGANNLGGSINLISKRPRQFDRLTISGSSEASYYSVADGKKGKMEFSAGSSYYGLRFNATRQEYSDYSSNGQTIEGSGFERTSYGSHVDIYPDDNKTLELNFLANIGRDVGYPSLPMDADKDEGIISSIGYTQTNLNKNWSRLSSKFYFNKVDHLMSNKNRDNHAMTQMEAEGHTRTLGGNIGSDFIFSDRLLKAGIDYYRSYGEAEKSMKMTGGMPMTSVLWPEASISDLGIYAECQSFAFTDLLFTAGLRADFSRASAEKVPQELLNYRGITADQANSAVSIGASFSSTYRFNDHFSGGASIARGSRIPEFSEYYSFYYLNRFDNYEYLGDPRLEIETDLNLELLLNVDYDRFGMEISGYRNLIDNFIVGRIVPGVMPHTMGAAGVMAYENLGQAEIRGVEGNWRASVGWGFRILGNMSYITGKNNGNGDPLPEIPPLDATLGVKYSSVQNGIWAQFDGHFAARQNRVSILSGEDRTPAFEVFDLRAGYTGFSHLHIYSGIENIFDREYYEHLSRANLPSAGRNIYLSVGTFF